MRNHSEERGQKTAVGQGPDFRKEKYYYNQITQQKTHKKILPPPGRRAESQTFSQAVFRKKEVYWITIKLQSSAMDNFRAHRVLKKPLRILTPHPSTCYSCYSNSYNLWPLRLYTPYNSPHVAGLRYNKCQISTTNPTFFQARSDFFPPNHNFYFFLFFCVYFTLHSSIRPTLTQIPLRYWIVFFEKVQVKWCTSYILYVLSSRLPNLQSGNRWAGRVLSSL